MAITLHTESEAVFIENNSEQISFLKNKDL